MNAPFRMPGIAAYAFALLWLLLVMAPQARAGETSIPLDAPVATRQIARGETIRAGDYDWRAAAPSAAQASGDPEGLIARRPILAGEIIRAIDVAAPMLVKRGETATLVAEAPGVRVTQIAVAMKSGAKGDIIEFRNVNSERVVKAVVIGENLAHAQMRPGI
jgi:flagella basal body P-ring formation protein FlgA